MKIVKITFNSLKLRTTKTGRKIWVWQKPKGKGHRPRRSEIDKFRELRSKASVKREVSRKKFKAEFKFHQTRSKNITYNSYCVDFDKGGILKLSKLFRTLGLRKEPRIRFYLGSWKASCLTAKKKCPKKTFIAHTKIDKFKIPREQRLINNDNFEDKYIAYLETAENQAKGIYKSDVCPRCGYHVLIEIIKICFQIVKVKGNGDI